MTCKVLSPGRHAPMPPPRPAVHKTTRIMSEGAIGVTIVSPKYAHLAEEAVTRFRRCAGLDAVIVWSEAEPAYAAKLNLDLLIAPRPIIFFDADLWFLRPVEFREVAASGRWCAVPDPCATHPETFCGKDVTASRWEPATYFNSGLFACDLARPEIRQVFADARARLEAVHSGAAPAPADTTDQYYLNWAVQQQPPLFKPLPLHLNFFMVAAHHGSLAHIPAEITGLHAAGVPTPRKLEILKLQAQVFGPVAQPAKPARTRPSALASAHAAAAEGADSARGDGRADFSGKDRSFEAGASVPAIEPPVRAWNAAGHS